VGVLEEAWREGFRVNGLEGWTWVVDGWIVAIGALAGVACAIPGAWLVARRESMMADAISHAVLPGIAVAFLATSSRAPLWMMLGAMAAAAILVAVTGWLRSAGKLERGAALGVTYTSLFAAGVLLASGAARTVDIDPSCVLFGSMELAPLDTVAFGSWHVPRAALLLAAVIAANLLVCAALWRPMLAASFDRAHASASGVRASAIDAAVMALSAATCVACFEAVGSILVIAMIVTPAVTARLFCSSIAAMAACAAIVGALGALLGHVMATTLPGMLGLGTWGILDASTSGSIAVALGALLALGAIARNVVRSSRVSASAARRTRTAGASD
jgi:manganese/zinc/iron transport system permease protein